jgi:hypothetical protein
MVSSCKRIRNVKSEAMVTECGGALARCFFPQEIIKRLRAEAVSYNPVVSEICHADFAADKGDDLVSGWWQAFGCTGIFYEHLLAVCCTRNFGDGIVNQA